MSSMVVVSLRLKNRLKCPFYSLRIGNTDFDV